MYISSIFSLVIFLIELINATKFKEFCDSNFDLGCEAHDEALMIKEATFGIILGKCINQTTGIDCSRDVTDRLNKECLGARACQIKNYQNELKNYKNCGKAYNAFLKVSYVCQKVERAPCASCSDTRKARIPSMLGYLASYVSTQSSCGQKQCPWMIEGKSGQKINLTLYDYSVYQDQHYQVRHSSSNKQKLFVIGDRMHKDDVVVYREAGLDYVRSVHSSLHSNIELHVLNTKEPFLIHFEVWGCADFEVAEGMWVERIGSHMKVGCAAGKSSWSLVCMRNEWKGKLGTCEEEMIAGMFGGVTDSVSSFLTSLPFSVLIAGVVSIALILSVCILTIGFVCYRKSNQGFSYKASRQGSSIADQYVDINDPNSSLVQKIMATQKKKCAVAQRENKYAMNNRVPAGTRPLPACPGMRDNGPSVNAAIPPRMMIRSYGDGMKRQSAENKYYCIENTLGHPEMAREDLDMFPPPPELLQGPDSSQGSADRSNANKVFVKNSTYENQQAILGTMATAGITAAAAASSEMLNRSMGGNEKGACISAPLNI